MKRNNKIFRNVIIVLAVLALITGCAGQEPEAEDTRTPTDDDLIVVGVSQEGSESVWRTANTRSVKETFTKENGYFLIFKNARQKQENQIKALRSFISQSGLYCIFSDCRRWMGYCTAGSKGGRDSGYFDGSEN